MSNHHPGASIIGHRPWACGLALLLITLSGAGCSTRIEGGDGEDLVNGPHTLHWTYVGVENYGRVVLIRYDGEFRDWNDGARHKFPMKWSNEQWFTFPAALLDLPSDLKPGSSLTLTDKKRFTVIRTYSPLDLPPAKPSVSEAIGNPGKPSLPPAPKP